MSEVLVAIYLFSNNTVSAVAERPATLTPSSLLQWEKVVKSTLLNFSARWQSGMYPCRGPATWCLHLQVWQKTYDVYM